ncbi:hypothetical protein P5G62_026140 [Neobacillus sp. 179-C4.2 HS]|jgi:hypothetical protein|uniref:Spore coat protein n=1 Tax=Neobacillus driksii TaxID=3035913 RepID=A0ABV4Z0I0_9BACI|nr:hypothetical protein [Neobacillus sp. 179.-C4.2 HS]MDP5196043.1 hypothetical protein [Neobacillus sp. 179.-C4.2 HS]
MYYYRSPYPKHDQRFIGFGLPFLGGLVGGLLGSALIYPRPFYGYPRPYYGYPVYGPPAYGYPGYGAPYYY